MAFQADLDVKVPVGSSFHEAIASREESKRMRIMVQRDATPVGGDRKKCKCNYCGKVELGGITRLKKHIAHVSKNVEACSRVPLEIRKMVLKLLDDGIKEKKRKFEGILDRRGFYGVSSKGSTFGAKRGISQSYGVKSGIEMPSTGFDPHMFPFGKRTIKDIISKEEIKKVVSAVAYALACSRLFLQYSSSIFNTCVFETIEGRQRVKEVIKRLEPHLIVQDNAINEIRTFIDKLGEFGTPLARQAVSTSLSDWLDEDNQRSGEGHRDNVQTMKMMILRFLCLVGLFSDHQKGKNDIDDETAEDDDDDNDGDDNDDNDGDGNVHKETQQSHGMTWAEGDKNYYTTQDTDHGHHLGIENQHQFLSNLTDYPSQCVDSQSERYDRRQPDIQSTFSPTGVINVGSYTTPYTQNFSLTSHDYRRSDDDDGDDHCEPHQHFTFF
ncbi:UNVERIFIED_CONTAM: hypothetical protein Scaly_2213900 [Sesamum calycinum]|uniref:BED-type domain-containing protein n=1 Tax=Sesamum calycinum TaxID=2727403 RepID=A0AAW2MNM7_9LAMI